MLFWIFVILLVVFGILVIYTNDTWLGPNTFCVVMFTCLCVAVSFSLIGFVLDHGCTDALVAEYQAKREVLVWQFENDIYDNDNDIGKRELMKDIQTWNEDIARKKINQDNFWIGIYIPDIYDQIELIDLNAIYGAQD